MSNTTNTEIQEIKQLIQDLSERVDKRFDKIEEKVEKRFFQVEEKIESLRNQQVETEKSVVEVKGLMEGWKPMINKLPDLSQQLGQQHALEANSDYCYF